MFKAALLLYVLVVVSDNEAARILAYYPTASISHQVVFRPLSLELARRGHDVVVMTTDPIYPKGDGPANLKEIDLHDLSYTKWKGFLTKLKNKLDHTVYEDLMKFCVLLIEEQIKTPAVQKILQDKANKFDLVIVEAYTEAALGLAHLYKAPVIQFSSLSIGLTTMKVYGMPVNPFVYPSPLNERLYNLTALEKINIFRHEYSFEQILYKNLDFYDDMLKRTFGPDVPSFVDLRTNVDLLFLNVHSVWDFNRPVPPNVVYLGGFHQKPPKELPQDLQQYLDSSKNGVIYVSFGTNVDPALFPPEIIQTFINVFKKLPYDILWKWNNDELPGRSDNIKISKWLPQSDLLRHPKVKLFITQGGLQSTDEAITAGVPLIGVPVFGDQNFNVEQFLHFGIGERVEIETISEDKLSNALNLVLRDESYRKNVEKLREIMNDQPQKPLDRAVWWTEYVIRHKGAKHLRSAAANMTMAEYFEFKLIGLIALGSLSAVAAILFVVYFLTSILCGSRPKLKKN